MQLTERVKALASAIATDVKELRESGGGGVTPSTPTQTSLKSLLCFYGYPIAYKELWDRAAVSQEIGSYDHWICGDTYEDPAQEVYADTVAIIATVKKLGTKVWGYIPLGMTGSNLTLAEIQTRINNWVAVGATGIFLDEFGFDYGVSRQRQREAIALVHAAGMNYVANAWVYSDVLIDNAADLPSSWASDDWRRVQYLSGNPSNLTLSRTKGDVLMLENYGVSDTGVTDMWDFLGRVEDLTACNDALPIPMDTWALAVVKEAAGVVNGYRNVAPAKILPFTSLFNLTKYLTIAATLHRMTAFGLGGYEFGSAGNPVYSQYLQPPTDLGPPGALVADYVAGTHTRSFGHYTIKITCGVAPLTLAKVNGDIIGPSPLATASWGLGDTDVDWLAEYNAAKA